MQERMKLALSALAIVVVVPWVWGNMRADSEAAQAARDAAADSVGTGAGARMACKAAIAAALKDPSSADWERGQAGYWGDWLTALNPHDKTAVVTPRFRAMNSFGAMVPSQWRCAARLSDGAWVVGSVDQVD